MKPVNIEQNVSGVLLTRVSERIKNMNSSWGRNRFLSFNCVPCVSEKGLLSEWMTMPDLNRFLEGFNE